MLSSPVFSSILLSDLLGLWRGPCNHQRKLAGGIGEIGGGGEIYLESSSKGQLRKEQLEKSRGEKHSSRECR